MKTALTGEAQVSVTLLMNPAVKRAIATIAIDAWEPIHYTKVVYDENTQASVSNDEVAEVPVTAFSSLKKAERATGPLVVRRIPERNPKAVQVQATLFDPHRFRAFFTTIPVTAVLFVGPEFQVRGNGDLVSFPHGTGDILDQGSERGDVVGDPEHMPKTSTFGARKSRTRSKDVLAVVKILG